MQYEEVIVNGQKMYASRCSPDCPYPWCVILSEYPPPPPPQAGGGQGQGSQGQQGDQQDDDNSQGSGRPPEYTTSPMAGDSGSNSSSSPQSGQGSSQSGKSDVGSSEKPANGNDRDDRPNGQSQHSDQSNGGGHSADDGQEDSEQEPQTEESQGGSSSQPESRDDEEESSSEQTGGQSDNSGSGDRETQPEEQDTPSEEENSEQDGQNESQQDGDADGDNQQEPQDSETTEEDATEDKQASQQEPVKPEPIPYYKPSDYKPVFAPDFEKDWSGQAANGQKGGTDGTGMVDLGKHDKRLEVITDRVFNARLRNVMKDNAYDRRVRGRKRGKLDMKSLYKVPAKRENVFTLKEAKRNKHYNVILLVDQSASMDGGPGYYGDGYGTLIEHAADAATFMAKSLGKVDVQTGVIGYDTKPKWHKKLPEGTKDDRLRKMKYDIVNTGGGGTTLLPALRWAYSELRKTPEYQNIVVNITDGYPSEGKDTITHFVHGNRRIADYIEIGIQNRPLTDHGFQIDNIEELKPLLIRELKKHIKRG
jgi:cobalamin biosynthesis protein CobT